MGFHQSRFGYPNVETLTDVIEKYASNKVSNVLLVMLVERFYMLLL